VGKRSNFGRKPNDSYDTPARAVWPLLHHVPAGTSYAEPCAGRGDLIRHLAEDDIVCRYASDIAPRKPSPMPIEKRPFEKVTAAMLRDCDIILTNPPWSREILHPLIEHFITLKPTWLLFEADWKYTTQSAPYLRWCHKIVSVGRVKWIPGSDATGKDNVAWYLFKNTRNNGGPTFYGRNA
jgi:hypothetical protein